MHKSSIPKIVFRITRLNKNFSRRASALTMLLSAALLWAAEGKAATVPEAPPPSRIHGLINLDVSDHYLTPRGLNVEDQGVIFQPLVLLFFDIYNSDTFINNVSLTEGVWNSVHTRRSGAPGQMSHWNEIDPISGVSVKFAKDFTLSVTYILFNSQNGSFKTSHNLETKLAYNDSKLLGKFALHPYVTYWRELHNKDTFATTPESYYFEVGIDPSYTFKNFPLTLDAPTYVNLPAHDFYGKSSVIGLFKTEFRATLPLTCVSKAYGNWSIYGGVKYFKFVNDALVRNGSFATGKRDTDEIQLSGGLNIFF